MARRVLLSWSSGKDSAWTLHVLRQNPDVEVVGLLTTVNTTHDRVAMHSTRRAILEAQARACGLLLHVIPLPWPCSNDVYERAMREAVASALEHGVTHVAFGDLFLEDIRTYREGMLAGLGLQGLYPVWGRDTSMLVREFLEVGFRAVLVCVDVEVLDASFAGRELDRALLAELPAGVDPCGENGEFHTFVFDGPGFRSPIAFERGDVRRESSFAFCDLVPA